MKVIAAELFGGTSFMEDCTFDLGPKGDQVLGAHMLEICETIAADKPSLEFTRSASAARTTPFGSSSIARPAAR